MIQIRKASVMTRPVQCVFMSGKDLVGKSPQCTVFMPSAKFVDVKFPYQKLWKDLCESCGSVAS